MGFSWFPTGHSLIPDNLSELVSSCFHHGAAEDRRVSSTLQQAIPFGLRSTVPPPTSLKHDVQRQTRLTLTMCWPSERLTYEIDIHGFKYSSAKFTACRANNEPDNQPPPAYELFDETTATLSIIQDGFNTQTHVRSMPSAILSNL